MVSQRKSSEKRYMTEKEFDAPPLTYVKICIQDHGNYPVDFPIPSQLSLMTILPEEREGIINYYEQARKTDRWTYFGWAPEEVIPIYQAPPNFADYVDRCYDDLASRSGDMPELNVDHWLYPGFYIHQGHVVAAIIDVITDDFTIFPWPNLLALFIGSYEPKQFPSSICDLSQLKLLQMHSSFHILPREIGRLSSLRAITFEYAGLSNLPDEFCNLHSLIYLNLDKNHLTYLPSHFGELIALRTLRVRHNKLISLPDSFGNLQSLERLDLFFNSLTDLPPSFAQCQALKSLLLENNRFTEFPPPLASIPSTCFLRLQGNQLRSLHGIPKQHYQWSGAHLPQHIYTWLGEHRDDEIAAYYARSTLDIATSLVQTGSLTTQETERLLHEATPAIRQYLEIHLPPTHPILKTLAERWKITLSHETDRFDVLL